MITKIEIYRIARFGFVGVSATLVYILTSTVMFTYVGLPAGMASLVAFAVSLVVSYFGHLKITYQRKDAGDLMVGARFAAVTVGLCLLLSFIAQLFVENVHLGMSVTSAIVGSLYAPLSYLLHSRWTFAAR